MTLSSGTRLGPYEVLDLIGAGGMGEVYRALDTRLDRRVAIKVLPADISADPDRRTRFEREAKMVATLEHPHICTLYDVGTCDGSLFLVMEHLSGETLAERLREGPLPLDQALAVASDIADALAAAHGRDVIHRDLKPANVMLTKSGAKLLDFGIAKLRSTDAALASSTVTALSSQGLRIPVSTGGGAEPVWSPSGGELFFRNGRQLLAARVQTRGPLAAGPPAVLFEGDFVRESTIPGFPTYDVAPDGRFLMAVPVGEQSLPRQLDVVVNWTSALGRRARQRTP